MTIALLKTCGVTRNGVNAEFLLLVLSFLIHYSLQARPLTRWSDLLIASFNELQTKTNAGFSKYERTLQSYSQTYVQSRADKVPHLTDVRTKWKYRLDVRSGFTPGNGGEIR